MAIVAKEPNQRVYGARGVHGRIVELLGRRIVGGAVASGSLLPTEAELALELRSSRTAVREALRVLAAKGLIATRQKSGSRVRHQRDWNLLDPDVLAWHFAEASTTELTRHVVELRRMIEPAAARLAATLGSPTELAAIDAAAAAMRANLDDPTAYFRADLAFHRALHAASGNPFVDRLGAIITAMLEVAFEVQQRSLANFDRGLAMHELVRDAICAGDAEGAEKAMLAIIDGALIELQRGRDIVEAGP